MLWSLSWDGRMGPSCNVDISGKIMVEVCRQNAWREVRVRALILLLVSLPLFTSCRADSNEQLQTRLEGVYAQFRAAALEGNKQKLESLSEWTGEEAAFLAQASPEEIKEFASQLPDISKFTLLSLEKKDNKAFLFVRHDDTGESSVLSTTIAGIEFIKQADDSYKVGHLSVAPISRPSTRAKEYEAAINKHIRQMRQDFGLEVAEAPPVRGLNVPRTVAGESKKAIGSIELPIAEGKCDPQHIFAGGDETKGLSLKERMLEYPGFDVVKLSLHSDGQVLTVAATLKNLSDMPPVATIKNMPSAVIKNMPSSIPGEVIALYFDIDNDRNTGVGIDMAREQGGGFDLKSQLYVCLNYGGGSYSCSGPDEGKVTGFFGAADLGRFGKPEGDQYWSDTEPIAGLGQSTKLPIVDRVVKAELKYSDLKVKSGQTIRILAQKNCSDREFSPEILLTLK